MRPSVSLLFALSSLLFATSVAATSADQSERPAPDQAIAIWDGDDAQGDASPAAGARGDEDLARYAQIENPRLHQALAVDKPSTASLPLAITPFPSAD